MFRLAIPAITAQLINALYNMVDRMYIGNLPGDEGVRSLGALGVCLPLIMIVSAFGTMVGAGGAALAAIKMGGNDRDGAEDILGNCIPLLVGFSAVIMAVCLIFCRDLLVLVGATDSIIDYAVSYFRMYILGTLPVLLVLGLNAFINTQGLAMMSMLTVLLGAVTNIVLDPILIYGFGMGVQGAAIATVVSQCLSALWVLGFLCGKRTRLRIRLSRMRPRWSLIGPVLALGVSPFIMNATESLVGIVINMSLKAVSPDMVSAERYIGAYSILASVMQLLLLPMVGLGQSVQPIISFNYGAKQFDRVKKAFQLFLLSSVAFTTALWAFVMLFPGLFVRLFSSDADLFAVAVPALRVYMLMSLLLGIQMACQQTFVAAGRAGISLFLALLRKVLLLIPLVLVFSRLWGVSGVFTAEPVADFLAVAVTALMFYRYRRVVFSDAGAIKTPPPDTIV